MSIVLTFTIYVILMAIASALAHWIAARIRPLLHVHG